VCVKVDRLAKSIVQPESPSHFFYPIENFKIESHKKKSLTAPENARLALAGTGFFLLLWLFLPPGALSFGPVTLRKEDVVRLLPLAIVAMIQPRCLLVRWHWLDVPVVLFCLCPLLGGLANNLGWQISLWETIKEFGYWFVPYLLGRTLLADGQNQFRFGLVLIFAALCYVPPTVYEIVNGPVLTPWFTGQSVDRQIRGAVRGTTFKPSVFLDSGFVLTMFYVLATLTALVALWRYASNAVSSQRRWCAVFLASSMLFVLIIIASKSLGSIVLLGVGMATMLMAWLTKATGAMGRSERRHLFAAGCLILLASAAPLYIGLRSGGWITTQRVRSIAMHFFSKDRVDSLAYRLYAEDIAFQRMQGHWWLGWGNWESWHKGTSVMALDGFWLYALTRTGMLSVIAWLAMVIIPIFAVALKRPDDKAGYASTRFAFALFMALSMIDSMFNYFGNAAQMLLVGSLTGSILNAPTYLITKSGARGTGIAE